MRPPRYFLKLQAKHPGLSRFDCERSILRGWKPEWSKDRKLSPSGKTWAWHMLRYMEMLFPEQDVHPFVRRQVKAVEVTFFIEGRRMVNVIGSQNSGKTDTAASLALAILSVDPEMTVGYAAVPFKNAADSQLWGRLGRRFDSMKKDIFKSARKVGERIVIKGGMADSGYLELRVIDKVASLQGRKAPDHTGKRGFLLILCDEIALFKNTALKEVLDNVLGGTRVLVITGCNFKNPDGMEGDLCRPENGDYPSLDIEKSKFWKSAYQSTTLRLDGHDCPNIKLGYDKYPYLLRNKRRQELEDQHGLQGPKYMEQVRSFPQLSTGGMTVLTRADLSAWGAYDTDIVWTGGTRRRVAFCDPGFGGDPACIQAFEFGPAYVFTADGKQVPMQIFTPICHPHHIKLINQMKRDPDWITRFNSAMQGKQYHRPLSDDVTIEQQIVIGAWEFLQTWDVEVANFGFDGSMRASIVQEFDSIMGTRVVAIDPLGKSTDRIANTRGEKACDLYNSFGTETWFAVGDIARAGQLRGAAMLSVAVSQMVRRTWSHVQSLRKIERKEDFKKRIGRSPDEADTVVGGLEMARRRGLEIVGKKNPSPNSGSATIDMLRGIDQSRKSRIVRLKTSIGS
jgi:hypothetical protein